MISIISRISRRTYLEEVARGLKLFGLYERMIQYKEIIWYQFFIRNSVLMEAVKEYLKEE